MEDIRLDILELVEKYKIPYKKLKPIIDEYGTMEEFFKESSHKYRLNSSNILMILNDYDSIDEFKSELSKSMSHYEYPFVKRTINIDDEDIENNKNTDQDIRKIVEEIFTSYKGVVIYSEERFKNLLIEEYDQRERDILLATFVQVDGKKVTDLELAKKHGIRKSEVSQIRKDVINNLEQYDGKYFILDPDSEAAKELIDSNIIFYPDEEYKDIPCDLNMESFREKIGLSKSDIRTSNPKTEEERKRVLDNQHVEKDISIKKMGFIGTIYKRLREADIDKLSDLLMMTKEELCDVHYLGEQGAGMIIAELDKRGLKLKDEKEYAKTDTPIEKLHFPEGINKHLKDAGVENLDDLLELRLEELLNLKFFGEKNADIIIKKLDSMGLQLKEKDDSQEEKDIGER